MTAAMVACLVSFSIRQLSPCAFPLMFEIAVFICLLAEVDKEILSHFADIVQPGAYQCGVPGGGMPDLRRV